MAQAARPGFYSIRCRRGVGFVSIAPRAGAQAIDN
jgi:hypothetical protein